MTLARRLAAEAMGTALLLAIVVGSGIMGERLSQGNYTVTFIASFGLILVIKLSLRNHAAAVSLTVAAYRGVLVHRIDRVRQSCRHHRAVANADPRGNPARRTRFHRRSVAGRVFRGEFCEVAEWFPARISITWLGGSWPKASPWILRPAPFSSCSYATLITQPTFFLNVAASRAQLA